jgi:hypothetical protein
VARMVAGHGLLHFAFFMAFTQAATPRLESYLEAVGLSKPPHSLSFEPFDARYCRACLSILQPNFYQLNTTTS